MMSPETERRERFWRWFFALLALLVPALVGYDFYFQWSTPVLDFTLDGHTGLVYDVPQGSFADWAGLMPGDVILSLDGVPFSEWRHPSVGNYQIEVERHGRRITLELPLVPLVKVNRLPLVSGVVTALVFWGVGTVLLWRRFQREDVRLLFLLAQVFAVATLLLLAHPTGTRPRWMTLLCIACFHLAAPLLLHHIVTFPVSLGSPRQRRWGLGLVYGLASVVMVGTLSLGELWTRLGVLYTTLEVSAAVGALIYVYARRATPDDRRRLRLIVFGNVLAGGPSILFYLLPAIVASSFRLPGWAMGLSLIVAPLAYLYATVRHNLFDIDRLLNRTLVYALLSMGILLLYLGPFLLIYRFAPGDPLAQTMVAAGLTLLVGLSFDWMRTRVQRLVDHLFYGGWYDYPGVVETISAALARTLEREQLTDVLTRQVPELMQLRDAQLQIASPAQLTNLPIYQSTNLQFPLTFQGQVRGLWTVGPRRDGDDLSADDHRILKTLARQTEVALSNVLLVETLRRQLDEMRAIQHQLLRSREEERARLARDLHAGPIQSLVAMNLQLKLLLAPSRLSLLGGEGSPPVVALEAIRAEVQNLLIDLRHVCGELRPPMLDMLGLGAALRALAGDWSAQHGVAVHLELPPKPVLSPLPGEVEVNLYRVVQEALSNVARHAMARRVTIRLVEEASCLTLTVQDDGRGFVVPAALHDLTAQDHFGLASMQERVGLIGGTLTVESAPGQGTIVRIVWQRDA